MIKSKLIFILSVLFLCFSMINTGYAEDEFVEYEFETDLESTYKNAFTEDLNNTNDFFKNWWDSFSKGDMVTMQKPNFSQHGSYGFQGGSISVAPNSPNRTLKPMSMQPPALSAGCGGLSLSLGGFSFLSLEELGQFLMAIISQAPSYFLELGLQILCPSCVDLMNTIKEFASMINSMQLDSCQALKMMGDLITNQVNKTAQKDATYGSSSSFDKAMKKGADTMAKVNKEMSDFFQNMTAPKNVITGEDTLMITVAKELNEDNRGLAELFSTLYVGDSNNAHKETNTAGALAALFGDVAILNVEVSANGETKVDKGKDSDAKFFPQNGDMTNTQSNANVSETVKEKEKKNKESSNNLANSNTSHTDDSSNSAHGKPDTNPTLNSKDPLVAIDEALKKVSKDLANALNIEKKPKAIKFPFYFPPIHGGKDGDYKSYIPVLNTFLYGNVNGQIYENYVIADSNNPGVTKKSNERQDFVQSLKVYSYVRKKDVGLDLPYLIVSTTNRAGDPIYYTYKNQIENIAKKFDPHNRTDEITQSELSFLASFKEPIYQHFEVASFDGNAVFNLVTPIAQMAAPQKAYEIAVELEKVLIESIQAVKNQLRSIDVVDEEFNAGVDKIIANIRAFKVAAHELYQKEIQEFNNTMTNTKTLEEVKNSKLVQAVRVRNMLTNGVTR